MTALPSAGPARTPPRPRPVLLPPGFVQEGAASAEGRAERARPDAGPTGTAPGAGPPADDGTGSLAALPSRLPEPRDPWAVLWTAVGSIVTTSMVWLGVVFAFLSPMWCDSCDKAQLHRFALYFWGYCGALLLPVVLVIAGASLPPYKRYATARIVFLTAATTFSVLLPVLYYALLGTVH
ncbi:hypothetical protein [Streptomyces sp. NPDC014733]|uniref:hypothetical protein n=1 Tax=Streptomyces sp. NPDC014733 TaxID=3364885 RepID=UPI0036FFDE16